MGPAHSGTENLLFFIHSSLPLKIKITTLLLMVILNYIKLCSQLYTSYELRHAPLQNLSSELYYSRSR